jgi:hypothetical protein
MSLRRRGADKKTICAMQQRRKDTKVLQCKTNDWGSTAEMPGVSQSVVGIRAVDPQPSINYRLPMRMTTPAEYRKLFNLMPPPLAPR